jgi:phosphoribosylaminoimidazole carboxylase (NCAIR synthetase)
MLCEAAGPLGIKIIVLDAENSPAKQSMLEMHTYTALSQTLTRFASWLANAIF